MSTFQINCPKCQRLLELPDAAKGKTAKCPACEETFTAVGPIDQALGTQSEANVTSEAAGFEKPQPGANPYADPLSGSVGGLGDSNPYAPAAGQVAMHSVGTVSAAPIQIRSIAFEEIWGPAWSIFRHRWGALLGAFAIVTVGSMVMQFAIQGITLAVKAGAGDATAGIVSIFLSIAVGLAGAYLQFGLACSSLAIVRNEPSPLSKLLPPMSVFLKAMGAFIIYMGLVAAIAGFLVGVCLALALLIGNEAAMIGLLVVGVGSAFAAMVVIYWLLWSLSTAVADDQQPLMDTLQTAYRITMQNKLTSLLLLVASAVLSILGLLACYVGIFATTPLMWSMMTVGYLKATSQPISDPEARAF